MSFLFGRRKAENVVDSQIKQWVSVTQKTIQHQASSAGATNSFVVRGCNTINISNVTQEASIDVKSKQFQTAIQESLTQQKSNEMLQQSAEQISQSLSLNLSKVDTSNMMSLLSSLMTSIQNTISQLDTSGTFAANVIDINNCIGNNSTVNASFVKQSVVIKTMHDMVLNSNQVATAKQDLVRWLDQHARNEEEDTFSSIFKYIFYIIIGTAGGVGAIMILKMLMQRQAMSNASQPRRIRGYRRGGGGGGGREMYDDYEDRGGGGDDNYYDDDY
jgi:hypothetical protein